MSLSAPNPIHVSDTDDELDIMSASSETLVSARSSPDKISGLRRSVRARRSLGTTPSLPAKRKRAMTLSAPARAGDGRAAALKRAKLDDRKAVTVTLHVRRAAVEAARRRWFVRHRGLLAPLLPPATPFFQRMEAELDASTDRGAYAPLHELVEQPKLVRKGIMKDYQLQGLSFLVWMYNNGMNCILGDEMGLGKTLQTLSLFAYIKENTQGAQDPHLVICPLSVLSSWLTEAARWLPSFRTIRFHGVVSERDRLKESLRGEEPFDLCITTYDAFVADDTWFKSRRWTYCVLDEGHKIKNAETVVAHKVQGMGSLFRLILTGTPVQNDLLELWGLLHWLYPGVFTCASQSQFKRSFDLSQGTYSLPFLTAAQQLLATVMLRRTKATVEADVPPREELTVFIPLTELQRFWTYRLLTRLDTMDLKEMFSPDLKLEDVGASEGRREVLSHLENQMQLGRTEGGQGTKWKKLMNLLMQLRKVCDHPYLLEDAEPSPFAIGEHIVAASSKLIVVDKLLADILPKGERVLIFSQWTSMLDLLEDFMALRSIPYARLDGSTSRPRRALDIRLFQQDISPYKVYLVSTKAGGLGINLTKATTVIMCDSDWNPQNDLQAIARAHRIGQTKTVKVYRLINAGSVEDQMLDRIRRKLFLSVKVMGGSDSSTSESATLGYSELMDILRKGSSALSRSDKGLDLQKFLDADIGAILENSRSREGARDAKMKQEQKTELKDEPSETLLKSAEEEERDLLSGIAQVRCRLFEGKMIPRAQENKAIAQEWQELQKRARVDRTVIVDGIQVIAAHLGPEVGSTAIKTPPKRTQAKFDHEDWCQYCRDGGEVIMCASCPRVFHAECHGVSKKEPVARCAQHSCAACGRSTAQSGGMLFRCQTCPDALCEDCLPAGEMDAVGDVLPEFLVLGYGQKDTAFYIRCQGCRQRFAEEPELRVEWQEEMRQTQRRLDALNAQA